MKKSIKTVQNVIRKKKKAYFKENMANPKENFGKH